MNGVSYLLQANLYLLILYGFYSVFLKRETFFNYNRAYLIGATLFSLIVPFLQTEWFKSFFVVRQVQNSWLDANVSIINGFASTIDQQENWSLGDYLLTIYFMMVVVLLMRFLLRCYSLKNKFHTDTSEAFSFFKKVKISEQLRAYPEVKEHEQVHAQQLHSADVLFFELVCILNWFNPVCYFYKRAIKETHEFIADAEAVKLSRSPKTYAFLLLSKSMKVQPHQLSNNFFNHSLLKTRIKMLDKPKSKKVAVLKYGLSVPLFLLAIVLSSATINESKVLNNVVTKIEPSKNISEILLSEPSIMEKQIVNNQKKKETLSISFSDTIPKTVKESKIVVKKNIDDTSVFSTIDVLPQFPGGLPALSKFLSENMKYPAEAKKNNIEGKVYCSFIVEKDGSVNDIQIKRGIGYGCDEEAVRVLSLSPKWIPGKQNGKEVKVSYVMPISFQLNKSAKTKVEIKETTNSVKITMDDNVNSKLKPLIVIDGKEMDASVDLNTIIQPNEIEKIDVLKGESATKAYGEKGKNGVILITKKK